MFFKRAQVNLECSTVENYGTPRVAGTHIWGLYWPAIE